MKLLPINRLAFQVVKLDTEDAIKANLKPKAGVPCLQINPNQGFEDDFYYCWFYEPVSITTYLYAGLALGTIFAVVLFPLWPLVMRKGVWYLSMAFLGLIASFFGIALIRLVLFCITYVVLKPGLWIFPNLFEDVGVIESFIPFWAWHGVDTMAMHKPKKRISKKKKLAKLEKKKAQEAAAQQTQQTAQQAAQQAANAQNTFQPGVRQWGADGQPAQQGAPDVCAHGATPVAPQVGAWGRTTVKSASPGHFGVV